jgi:dTDP-4-dehydrorhamnose reductase
LIDVTHSIVDKGLYGIFHVVGDERISKYEFGLKLSQIFGLDGNLIKPTKLANRSDLTRRPLDLSLFNDKARKVLGRNLGGVDSQLELLRSQENCQPVVKLL